ncbi:hypothetical protein [Rummeliibacillus sp. BSL5]
MIEKILQNNLFNSNNPIVLKNCTLFFRLKHFEIDDVFLFHRQDTYPFSIVGELWLKGRIQTEYNSKGYFSTKFYTIEHFHMCNHFDNYSAEEISIIGYYEKKKIQVSGISLIKNKLDFNEGLTCKFSFIEWKIY